MKIAADASCLEGQANVAGQGASRFMLRAILAIGLTLAAVLLIVGSLLLLQESRAADMMLNLGTEVLGIALTVAIVDWLIERNKLRDESQRLAWRMLHDIDHAVWVWQGGRREFHLDEMNSLLGMVEEKDAMPECTKELLVNLGSTASDDLRLHRRIFKFDPRLKKAVTYLQGLAQIRELKQLMPNSFIVQSLQEAMVVLAAVVQVEIQQGSFGVARTYRDNDPEVQKKRFLGARHEFDVRATQSLTRPSTDSGTRF